MATDTLEKKLDLAWDRALKNFGELTENDVGKFGKVLRVHLGRTSTEKITAHRAEKLSGYAHAVLADLIAAKDKVEKSKAYIASNMNAINFAAKLASSVSNLSAALHGSDASETDAYLKTLNTDTEKDYVGVLEKELDSARLVLFNVEKDKGRVVPTGVYNQVPVFGTARPHTAPVEPVEPVELSEPDEATTVTVELKEPEYRAEKNDSTEDSNPFDL
jgi:hypothetical protein